MLCLAVTNLAQQFYFHSRFESLVVVVELIERLANRVEFLDLNVGTTPPFKILFNDIHHLTGMNWF